MKANTNLGPWEARKTSLNVLSTLMIQLTSRVSPNLLIYLLFPRHHRLQSRIPLTPSTWKQWSTWAHQIRKTSPKPTRFFEFNLLSVVTLPYVGHATSTLAHYLWVYYATLSLLTLSTLITYQSTFDFNWVRHPDAWAGDKHLPSNPRPVHWTRKPVSRPSTIQPHSSG